MVCPQSKKNLGESRRPIFWTAGVPGSAVDAKKNTHTRPSTRPHTQHTHMRHRDTHRHTDTHLSVRKRQIAPHLSEVQVGERLRALSHPGQEPREVRMYVGRNVCLQEHQVRLSQVRSGHVTSSHVTSSQVESSQGVTSSRVEPTNRESN